MTFLSLIWTLILHVVAPLYDDGYPPPPVRPLYDDGYPPPPVRR
jgi:hypothetical protein